MSGEAGNLAPQLGVAAGAAAFGAEFSAALYELRWMLLAVVVLITADFCYGIADSVARRGEDFQLSRAGRRTACKFIEYLSYLLVGLVLGFAIMEPLGICGHVQSAAAGLLLAVVWEADSIAEHVCSLHGLGHRFSIKGLIIAYLSKKFGNDFNKRKK